MRVRINRELCRGHGVCCGYAPEIFELDDADKARAKFDEIPAAFKEHVRMALQNCPERAIDISE